MKKPKSYLRSTLAAAWLLVCATATPNAHAVTLKSGADCNAANLTQALLGISMSQSGIVNNSNQPLFVVCSVDIELLGLVVGDVLIEGVFPAAPAAGATTPNAIPCTYRIGLTGMSGFASAALTLTAGLNSLTPGPIDPLRGINSVATAIGAPNIAGALVAGINQTMVCALDPGEGISGIITA